MPTSSRPEREPVARNSAAPRDAAGPLDIAGAVRDTTAKLRAADVPSPESDAVVLVAHTLGCEPSDVRTAAARGDSLPAGFDASKLADVVARRVDREPLQHITGRAPFRTLELAVGPGVFVPRPETELLAGAAIDAVAGLPDPTQARVADLCTGSGAVALAIATETDALVWAVELSAAAVAFLERNVAAQPAHVRDRVSASRADARTALTELDGTLDVVAANPPYIPGDARPVEVEVARYDPPISLYGLGGDGLEVPRGIIAAAARLLRPGGRLFMEHGAPQAEAVRAAVEATGAFDDVRTHEDLAGWDRFVSATRR